MDTGRERHLPPGHQPYDPLNGIRIGALAGGIIGVIVAAVTSLGGIVTVAVAAVAGGIAGLGYERRSRGA